MLDFAPLYSGVIMGVSNTVANFTGILAPLSTGLLLDAGNTLEQWRAAFWISAAIYVSGWVAFQVGYNYNKYGFKQGKTVKLTHFHNRWFVRDTGFDQRL